MRLFLIQRWKTQWLLKRTGKSPIFTLIFIFIIELLNIRIHIMTINISLQILICEMTAILKVLSMTHKTLNRFLLMSIALILIVWRLMGSMSFRLNLHLSYYLQPCSQLNCFFEQIILRTLFLSRFNCVFFVWLTSYTLSFCLCILEGLLTFRHNNLSLFLLLGGGPHLDWKKFINTFVSNPLN